MNRPDLFRRGRVLPAAQRKAMGLGAPPPSSATPPQVVGDGQDCYLQPGQPGQQLSVGTCSAERVVLAGGALTSLMVDPLITPFEQLFRALPEEGMFNPNVTPSRPFVFELGSFTPQQTMALALFDLRPDIYRFSGINAGDTVPVEARRFSSALGFDVTIDKHHNLGAYQYQLDPAAINHGGSTAFRPPAGSTDLFTTPDISASQSSGVVAGVGASLQPQRPDRPGAGSIPWMLLVRSGQVVQFRCVVFHPIPHPIAWIEYDIAGIILSEKIMDAYLSCVKPTADVPR